MKTNSRSLALDGIWEIRPLEAFRQGFYPREDGWLSIPVPSHWQDHPALQRHVGKVAYRRHFRADPQPGRRYWLRLDGVFYWSRPFLNGVDLGLHEGYFNPQEHDVTAALAQENLLVVEVDCPDEHDKANKRLITGVFSHWDCIDPRTNPGGIWLPVSLIETGPARLVNLRCHTERVEAHLATVAYGLTINAATTHTAELTWTFAPRNFAGEVQTFRHCQGLTAGEQEIRGTLAIRDPRLWWSHDLGHPNLYDVSVQLTIDGQPSDVQQFAFGLRLFELRDWIAYLNGQRLLIKGNNYAPGDTRIARMTNEAYQRDIQLAVDCHMNLLRVHAHVEHPAFYRAADEAGLLLWQDFPLQWLYRRSVLEPARRQVRAMTRLLYNHPSIVIWCMHNEPVYLADTKDETRLTRYRTIASAFGLNWNRQVLDPLLKKEAQYHDPTRPVIRSSGEFYVPGLSGGGDGHFYFGWYLSYGRKRLFDELRQRFPRNIRFVTEFGAQSFPNIESCARFMPTDINKLDVAQLTDRHHFQPEAMANWYDWRSFESLEELVRYSQDYQSEINRYYIDRLRYHKYRPTGGIVPFVFNDSNPAVQWSVVDYWRVPKQSYYALKLAFKPDYIFTLLDHDYYQIGQSVEIPVYVVNDSREPLVDWPAEIRLIDPAGESLARVRKLVTLEADSLAVEIERLRFQPELTGAYCLHLGLGEGDAGMQQVYVIEVGTLNGNGANNGAA
jgi:beta-mannosidase